MSETPSNEKNPDLGEKMPTLNSLPEVPQITLRERFNNWLQRRWWRFQYRCAHRNAFNIATMGQENGHAQTFLNAAKDNLYLAAREFDLMADSWERGRLSFRPRKARSVPSGNENHLATPSSPKPTA